MIDRAKLSLQFDPQKMRQDLERIQSEDWIEHFVRQNYEGDWNVVALRGPAGATHPVMAIYSDPTCTEFADTPCLDVCPYFRYILASFWCPLQAVRLMSLFPGSRIKEHKDHDLSAEEGMARLHIPVVTNSDVEFRLNGTRVVMNEGECWYLKLCDTHSVSNNGASPRIHLVIDAKVNSWLMGLIRSAGVPE